MRIFQFYFVSTPIGNLGDFSERAAVTLRDVDLILAEDKRKTGILLSRYRINNKLRAYHDHNKKRVTPDVIKGLKEGLRMALVTDGGTPLISDPGFYLIRELIKNDIEFTVVPGPTAPISALVLSGFPPDRFTFFGYMPRKKGKKEKLIEKAGKRKETSIFFESPYRLLKTLEFIKRVLGDRDVVVARELTKRYEDVRRGPVSELIEYFSSKKVKGEITLLIKGSADNK
ncbi:MAG TPA: 16S rRNA (cytidine(1402)-2'-O)-methyltransferase [Candidatus Krumholzibacteriaceae bacterium]|nr:16S rRNA (cytidine(1402)-2'-O)-methyltransferase [Candidatus Krumholzibacteriaceae bacterium]